MELRANGSLGGTQLFEQAMESKQRGDLTGAIALFGEAEGVFRQLGKVGDLATTLAHHGIALGESGELTHRIAAPPFFKEAEQIFRQMGNLDQLQRVLLFHVDTLQKDLVLSSPRQRLALLDEAELICRQLGNSKSLLAVLMRKVPAHLQENKRKKAMLAAEEAHQFASTLGDPESVNHAKTLLDRVRSVVG